MAENRGEDMENMKDFVTMCRNSDKEALIQNYGLQRVMNRALERRVDELSQQNDLLRKQLEVLSKENRTIKEDYCVMLAEFGQFKKQHGFLDDCSDDDL